MEILKCKADAILNDKTEIYKNKRLNIDEIKAYYCRSIVPCYIYHKDQMYLCLLYDLKIGPVSLNIIPHRYLLESVIHHATGHIKNILNYLNISMDGSTFRLEMICKRDTNMSDIKTIH